MLSGQKFKFVESPLSLNSKRDLDAKKTAQNIEVYTESPRAMLEQGYVQSTKVQLNIFSRHRQHVQYM